MRVIVLAAGRGDRLSPITDSVPKPLVEVNGFTELELNIAVDRLLKVMNSAPYLASLKPRVVFCGRTLEIQSPPAGAKAEATT